jgi:hypothetical protein
LKRRTVRFTATAQRHVRREQRWWIENRVRVDVVAAELEVAVRTAALLPGSGSAYDRADVAGLRRVYLPRVACHLYYTFTDDEVIIRALWGARRERGPNLKP